MRFVRNDVENHGTKLAKHLHKWSFVNRMEHASEHVHFLEDSVSFGHVICWRF